MKKFYTVLARPYWGGASLPICGTLSDEIAQIKSGEFLDSGLVSSVSIVVDVYDPDVQTEYCDNNAIFSARMGVMKSKEGT